MGRVKIISRTENEFMTMNRFLAACPNGNSSHYYEQGQIDHHRSGILVPWLNSFLEYIELLSLYDVNRLAGHDLLLCSLARSSLQMIDWSRYGCDNSPFLSMNLRQGRWLRFHGFAVTKDPRRVLVLLLVIKVTSFYSFKRYSSPVLRGASPSGSSLAVLWAREAVLK